MGGGDGMWRAIGVRKKTEVCGRGNLCEVGSGVWRGNQCKKEDVVWRHNECEEG